MRSSFTRVVPVVLTRVLLANELLDSVHVERATLTRMALGPNPMCQIQDSTVSMGILRENSAREAWRVVTPSGLV